jgi:hypothetical protein
MDLSIKINFEINNFFTQNQVLKNTSKALLYSNSGVARLKWCIRFCRLGRVYSTQHHQDQLGFLASTQPTLNAQI